MNGLYAAHHLDPLTNDVLVLEGPKDVAIALSHGFNAVGILSSSSKPSQEDIDLLSQYKRIYLIGDQDIQGKAAMDALQKRLPEEKVIRVWLHGFKDVGELYAEDPQSFKHRLNLKLRMARASRKYFDLDDLLTDAEITQKMEDTTPEIVERLIPANAITMFFGEEKSGKSLLVYYILKCIANGTKVFGVLSVIQRPVLYLDRENSVNDIAGMVEHFLRIGKEPVHCRNRVTGCPEVDDAALIQFCEKHKPVLVLDSLTRFLKTANPFHPKEMADLFDKMLDLCAAGATVSIIHHSTRADFEKYANSHQIGASVSRAFCVISEDRPQLHRVRLEAKLFRGAEPQNFYLIGFPVIDTQGMFGLVNPGEFETDADKVVAWVAKYHPNGCLRQAIKDKMRGLSAARKMAAVTAAIKERKLHRNKSGILTVLGGSRGSEPPDQNSERFPNPEPVGNLFPNSKVIVS